MVLYMKTDIHVVISRSLLLRMRNVSAKRAENRNTFYVQ